MARQGERQLLGRDAAAVVGDGDALDAAFFQRIVICVAPASSAFSSSSLTTAEGRSTTSPAAICEISWSFSCWMGRWVGTGAFMPAIISRAPPPYRREALLFCLAHRNRRVAQVDVTGRDLGPRSAAVALASTTFW
jgi:hypothetical protein